MTDRLYYADSYAREFDATIESVHRDGGRLSVVLDRTCFYPTSGGQPYDTGAIESFRVMEVLDADDGTIVHVVDGGESGLQPGSRVHGAIDWARRFDHMQQHTGQHVLSAAFDRLFGARTVSFHLGSASATIDLARELTPGDIAQAEDEANRVVWDDRPVSIRFATAADAARLPLRKESIREGTLRLVDVDQFDLSACGGTHVAATGAIGIIAVAGWERFKGGQRIEFVCGGRALAWSRSLRDTTAAAIRLLSTTSSELPAAIEKLQAETKEQRKAIGAVHNELSRYRAEELTAGAESTAKGRVVFHALDADANALKALASAISAKPGHAAVLVSVGTPALVVIARAPDLSFAANQLLSTLIERFGGRGGGKPDIAQGGGLAADADAILSVARAALTA
jgi:alanyl-tRNA synthetase